MAQKNIPSLGEQEMELLKYVSQHAPISVRDVAAHFERSRGLARTTVLTVMERLRKKGVLSRTQADGVFKYSAKIETEAVLHHKISDFVEKTLSGSFRPLMAHFLSSTEFSDQEIAQLQELAAKLDRKLDGKSGN